METHVQVYVYCAITARTATGVSTQMKAPKAA